MATEIQKVSDNVIRLSEDVTTVQTVSLEVLLRKKLQLLRQIKRIDEIANHFLTAGIDAGIILNLGKAPVDDAPLTAEPAVHDPAPTTKNLSDPIPSSDPAPVIDIPPTEKPGIISRISSFFS